MIEFTPFILSFKLAFLVTLILFIFSLPFAWWLSQTHSKAKPFLEAITALPLVLPPSVLGFYLLVVFSPQSGLGLFLDEYLNIQLVFSFSGLVIASCFYSLPFMVQPLQNGFESLNKHMLEASYLAGKSEIQTIYAVALPNMKPALLTALIITFAHTVGEFGVVLMVGGSIPEETRVASIAIYEMVEIMDYKNAHIYSAMMLVMSFMVLIAVYVFNHKQKKAF
ncbi:Molybdenum transport system permease protein ModB (TC 3.A.1.8.1) [hydrothermal vent metagenome]|uniref:Molybdenum transport system permease protein ModB (TC 3.A.1.8.1) n=1 Tax=hydrothermal vent metagenome TaxID=652676 RepID=A0A1W1C5F1_9ZZZZ